MFPVNLKQYWLYQHLHAQEVELHTLTENADSRTQGLGCQDQ